MKEALINPSEVVCRPWSEIRGKGPQGKKGFIGINYFVLQYKKSTFFQ